MIMAAMAIAGAGSSIIQGINAKNNAKTNAAIARADLAVATANNQEKINKMLKQNYKAFSINSLNDTIKLMQTNSQLKEDYSYQNLGLINSSVVMEGSSISNDLKDVVSTQIMMNTQELERSQKDQLYTLENNADMQFEESAEAQDGAYTQIETAKDTAVYNANAQIIGGVVKAGTAAASAWEDSGQEFKDNIKTKFSDFGKRGG